MCKRDKIKGDKEERGGKGGVPLTITPSLEKCRLDT
jgi:hypothetical protein